MTSLIFLQSILLKNNYDNPNKSLNDLSDYINFDKLSNYDMNEIILRLVDNSDFEDAVYYKQYAYDVTLMDGHTAALRSSLKGVTGFGGQKSIFTDDELRSLSSPVLALWGAEDPVFPVEHGYRLARLVPSSHLHVFENAKHVPLLDHPFEVNDLLLGFLAEG